MSYDSQGRVSKVTLPIPDPLQARPEKTYEYLTGKTRVHVAGAMEPNGYAREVTLDAAGRLSEDRDAQGAVTSFEWDEENRLTRTTDPTTS